MTNMALDSLETVFPEVIALMESEFDSHQFILALAQAHQRLYVAALSGYADTDRPFQIVHGELAKRLYNFPNLVTKVGEHYSEDIFRQANSAAVWRKAS